VSKSEKVGLLSFAVATPIEYFALIKCLEWFLARKRQEDMGGAAR
jgi:hypothetical protein